jgi:hypothetical protein
MWLILCHLTTTAYETDIVSKEAKKLKDKVCYEVFGNWVSKLGKVNVNGDGTFT